MTVSSNVERLVLAGADVHHRETSGCIQSLGDVVVPHHWRRQRHQAVSGRQEQKNRAPSEPCVASLQRPFAQGVKRQLVVLTVTGLSRKGAVPTRSTAASA